MSEVEVKHDIDDLCKFWVYYAPEIDHICLHWNNREEETFFYFDGIKHKSFLIGEL